MIIISIVTVSVIFVLFVIDFIQRKRFVHRSLYMIKERSDDQNQITISISKNTSIIVEKEILIYAPVNDVWLVLTDIDNWNKWQSSVTYAKLDGVPKQGVSFKWEADGLRFESIIHTYNSNKSFGWIGVILGVQAIHNWKFIDEGNKTRVLVSESLQGILPSILRCFFKSQLEKGILKNLNELKNSCDIP